MRNNKLNFYLKNCILILIFQKCLGDGDRAKSESSFPNLPILKFYKE